MGIMITLIISNVNWDKKRIELEQEYKVNHDSSSDQHNSYTDSIQEKLVEIDERVYKIEMTTALFAFINIICAIIFIINNYQSFIDYWRKSTGQKSEELYVSKLKNKKY
ncbi:MAG: hypothetical protein COC01_06990 [Bacteroidetes bacterium]|nr:MAG: hypothetical protein COC01_06990 [Bacteroidota bacterium]